MSTASITQQQQRRPASESQRSWPTRTNPWQRALALIALVPALIGGGICVAALLNHNGDGTALAEFAVAAYALVFAGSLALLWLLAAAVNWQIKEATRSRG